MSATITIQTKSGPLEAATVWAGAHLAVHRPPSSKSPSGFITAPATWAITHKATGYAACPTFRGAKNRAVKLARLWDAAFEPITVSGSAKGWPLSRQWLRDLEIAQHETFREPNGPDASPLAELEAANSAADIEAAVRRAMGYQPVPADEAAAQYPADITRQKTGAGAVRRNGDSGELEYWWLPRGGNYPFGDAISLAGWYPVPALGDIESWCLGSLAETPCGDSVEPDHPDAWPSLLGLI